MGHSLQRALLWSTMAGLTVTALNGPRFSWRALGIVLAAIAWAVVLFRFAIPVASLWAMLLVTAAIAACWRGPERPILAITLESILVLALYRLALFALPCAWLVAEQVGHGLGAMAGLVFRVPVDLGPTFAGLDFLVVMIYLAIRIPIAGFSRGAAGRCVAQIGVALVAVLVAQMIYWSVLSHAPGVVSCLPKPDPAGDAWNPYPENPAVPRILQEWFQFSPEEIAADATLRVQVFHAVCRPLVGIGVALRGWLPWNTPVVALLLQGGVAWFLFRHGYRMPNAVPGDSARTGNVAKKAVGRRNALACLTAFGIAVGLGIGSIYAGPASSLEGKKIVFYEKGFLNWLRPHHGDYGYLGSIGMYGVMPDFLRSHGANPVVSPDLSAADLADASAVVLIYPNSPWTDGQLERIEGYVRRGGTLLILGEHTTFEADLVDQQVGGRLPQLVELLKSYRRFESKGMPDDSPDTKRERDQINEEVHRLVRQMPLSRFNEVLDRLGADIRVAFDSAMFQVGGWLQSYETTSHPTTLAIGDNNNSLGIVIGASLEVKRPARPLIMGRWGWNAPGDVGSGPAMMGSHEYEGGERLGDVVLAAEQEIDRGRVIVFGDTSSFTNGIMYHSHDFLGRMFAYLATPAATAQTNARQQLNLALLLAMACILLWKPTIERIAVGGLAVALTMVVATWWTCLGWQVLGDGFSIAGPTQAKVNRLALIDEATLGDYSSESDRGDAVLGLRMNLMRDGYLVLSLSEITRERLLVGRERYVVRAKSGGPILAETFVREDAEAFAKRKGGGVESATVFFPRARLLVSIAPGRSYTASEQASIDAYVAAGGVFICTVGYDRSGPVRDFLAERGFFVGGRKWAYCEGPLIENYVAGTAGRQWRDTIGEPRPLGHFKSPFLRTKNFMSSVRFHAGWPVEFVPSSSTMVLCSYPPDAPLIILSRHKQGMFVVIGDSKFALNMNLETRDGSPFEKMRENIVFWRWFLSLIREGTGEITGKEMWFPEEEGQIPEEQQKIRASQAAPKSN
jgi:hypothetical protein